MRLGMMNFILPFLFVLNPALILHGAPTAILQDVTTAVIEIWPLAAGSEGRPYGVGRIGIGARVLVVIAGFGLLKRGIDTDLFAIALVASVYAATIVSRRRRHTLA